MALRKRFTVLMALTLALSVVGCDRAANNGGLKLTGTVETTTVALSFKVPGRLEQRLFDEGQTVKAGQVVARLEDAELREEQLARSAQERAARAALNDLQAGSRREEIAQGEAALARVRAEALQAAEDARRMESLFKREVVSRKDLDAARTARDSSAAVVRETEERLRLLKAGPRPDAVRQLQASLESAVSMRALADTRLSQAVLTSPVSGQVLAKHAEPGEMLAAGSPVLTVGKLDEIWIRAYIPETELGRIKLGQQAQVTSDTWPGKSYTGSVSFIAQQAEFTPKNVQTATERVKLVYRIKITVPNPQLELKPGMPVDAVIKATP